ncbi:hypothetical protein C1645_735475 [Glomus cerebriforme]|uniref:Uncharacterized protein n=1 Tax=Glomus cerebriforme TaxID=658196 RepID=A0A397T6R5_9GLOM|nr:hypothetical protein C1645_735475 [Glomus cerebriforme]
MDYNKEKKLRYVKSGSKWFDAKRFKGRWDDIKYFNDKEAVLLDLENEIEKELLKKLGRKNKPQVIIIDGVDGIEKSTVVENIIKQLEKKGLKKTESFDRGYISPYGNHKMEKEIFKYKEIIDNAIVIFLENKECWNNYIGRETKKSSGEHKASYETLNEKEYMDMIKMFKEH